MQLLQNCIGPTIHIGQEILCLPYAGFFLGQSGVSEELTHYWETLWSMQSIFHFVTVISDILPYYSAQYYNEVQYSVV